MGGKMNIPKNPRLKSKKITGSAKGEDCTLRMPGVCNFNPDTTVFAHIGGAGMGLKAHDIHGFYACSDCHDLIDNRNSVHIIKLIVYEKIASECLRAMIETQSILIQKGLIQVK